MVPKQKKQSRVHFALEKSSSSMTLNESSEHIKKSNNIKEESKHSKSESNFSE